MDGSRGHAEDADHRDEVRNLIHAAFRAAGLAGATGSHWSFMSDKRKDLRASSIQKWGELAHFRVTFVFDGLDVPAELAKAPGGESAADQRARAKMAVKAVRELKGLSQLAMDRLLDQQNCGYNQWERRMTDFNMAAMQRTVRALGGVFRVELEHLHNPGLFKRINNKMR